MTTERYDNQKLENLQIAVLRLESGKRFDPNDTNEAKRVDDRTKFQVSFKIRRRSLAWRRCASVMRPKLICSMRAT